jgi:hypothetical protein
VFLTNHHSMIQPSNSTKKMSRRTSQLILRSRQANIFSVRRLSFYNSFQFQELNKYAATEPKKYWYDKAEVIPWFKRPTLDNVLDASDNPFYRWFPDGGIGVTMDTSLLIVCRTFVWTAHFHNYNYYQIYLHCLSLRTYLK